MTSSIIVVLKGNMEETNHLFFACAIALTGIAVIVLKEKKEETIFFFISPIEND